MHASAGLRPSHLYRTAGIEEEKQNSYKLKRTGIEPPPLPLSPQFNSLLVSNDALELQCSSM